MPLDQFLRQDAFFGPDDLEAMTAAFDEALRRLGLKDRTDKLTELVARDIIALARLGQRDPETLCEGVLASLSQRRAPSGESRVRDPGSVRHSRQCVGSIWTHLPVPA